MAAAAVYILVLIVGSDAVAIHPEKMTLDACEAAGDVWDGTTSYGSRSHACLPTKPPEL